MLPSDYQGLDMQELYNANRHHEIFQQRFLHRLSPAHQRRFFNSLLRCLPASFPIKMTQRPLSDFMADRFEDASPFTIDTWVEDLSPNTDMVLFAALVSRLPYSRISLIDMELYGDTPELLMVDIGLRFLTIAANDLEQLMFLKYWASFLRQVPRLEHLRIQDRTTEGWSHNGIDAMINGVHLPCLSVLVIEDIHFGFEQLFTFLAAHTSSLTQVKLLGYCMDEGQHLQSFLFAARGRAWTRQFKWTITEKHNSRWEAGFLRAFEAYIFTNVDVPGHPRDVGRFFM